MFYLTTKTAGLDRYLNAQTTDREVLHGLQPSPFSQTRFIVFRVGRMLFFLSALFVSLCLDASVVSFTVYFTLNILE